MADPIDLEQLQERTPVEDEFSRVINALPALIWTALPDGDVDFLSQRWCEYTGLTSDEACGRDWQSTFHPEDLTEALKRWRSIFASGELGELEARVRRFDGLSVSRSIVESHHGRLWALSNDSHGATFSFSMPYAIEGGNLSSIQESALNNAERA